jgi:protein-disulfide isomerase
MKQEALIPTAILLAGVILAFTIYSVRHHTPVYQNGNPMAARPISSTDHVLGNPAAPIAIIEYGDIDTEYSKKFQKTMEQVITDYGSTSNVAWVYRHIPDEADPNALQNDEASECVNALGGAPAFFKFIDTVQAESPSDSQFDPANYDDVVTQLGLSSGTFDDCMTAHTYQGKVMADYDNSTTIGANGVPYSVLLIKGQQPQAISGSLDYSSMKTIIDQGLAKILAH